MFKAHSSVQRVYGSKRKEVDLNYGVYINEKIHDSCKLPKCFDSDANVRMDSHVARMGSRGVEVEMFGGTSWKRKMEDEE